MGGPSVIVLLRAPLTEQQIDDLEAWLRINTAKLEGTRLGWHFMMSGSPFDISPDDTSDDGLRSFGLSESEPQMEESELEKVCVELGFTPQRELDLGAMAKGRWDHLLLGHLALFLAERYDGAIDFGDLITGRRRQDWDPRLNAIPGKAIEIEMTDDRPSGDGWYHVVDTTFMRGWLRDPDFHLIK